MDRGHHGGTGRTDGRAEKRPAGATELPGHHRRTAGTRDRPEDLK
jgi:hypothetical protein